MTTTNAKQEILETIIKNMEKTETAPWTAGWLTAGLPYNLQSGHKYQGINVLIAWAAGFNRGGFLTYKQAVEMKAQVKKGSKGTRMLYFTVFEKEKISKTTGEKEKVRIPYAKWFYAFNETQIEGLEGRRECVETIENKDVEAFIKGTGVNIEFGHNPAYIPQTDTIEIPYVNDFKNEDEYYAALFHELIHWTGEPHRLGRRDTGTEFGSKPYAQEELTAEIGAAFLMSEFGIVPPRIENNAAYVKSWMKALEGDTNLLFQAASKAQRAVDWLLGRDVVTTPVIGSEPISTSATA